MITPVEFSAVFAVFADVIDGVSFTEFNVEPISSGIVWDYLEIYDGATTSGTLIGKYYGTDSPGIVTATNGSLTFKFYSDVNTEGTGWVADVTCVSPVPTPIAGFTATPLTICEGGSVTFTDESTNVPTSWSWNFGDASALDENQNTTHIYTNPGTYTVVLTATNSGGSDEESTDITVIANPNAGTNGALTICEGTMPTNAELFTLKWGFRYSKSQISVFFTKQEYSSSPTDGFSYHTSPIRTGVPAVGRVDGSPSRFDW